MAATGRDLWFAPTTIPSFKGPLWLRILHRLLFGNRHFVNRPLLGTRHTLTGTCYVYRMLPNAPFEEAGTDSYEILIKGTVHAPDHPPVRIDRPTVVMRTDAFQWNRHGDD